MILKYSLLGIPSYYELSLAYKFNLDAAKGLAIGGVFRQNNNLSLKQIA